MKRKICGYVVVEPVRYLDGCIWGVKSKGSLYWIISSNLQAVKDFIFIHEGQKVDILGETTPRNSRILFSEEAKIDIEYLYKKVI